VDEMDRRISELESAASRIEKLAERRSSAGTNSNASNINVTLGGNNAVWFCAAMALSMFVGLIVSSIWISDRFSRMDAEIVTLKADNAENKVFLQDIWRQAPHLRPKDK
jgi:hypothetical protein